jgi:deoxyribodipyrimidine photo-lyase
MTAFRRTNSNFALQRAVELAQSLRKPLLVLESLRAGYRWACDRFHQFVIDGMLDNAESINPTNAMYCAFVEKEPGKGHGLIEAISKQACVVVSDDFPCFFHPALYRYMASRVSCKLELVDSNTIVPMRNTDRIFTVAHSYRRYMQKEVTKSFPAFPLDNPLDKLTVPKLNAIPVSLKKWDLWIDSNAVTQLKKVKLSAFAIDHAIVPTSDRGGAVAAQSRLKSFVRNRLSDYAEARNEPEQNGSSGLSPYLHFGHISPHDVFQEISESCNWSLAKMQAPNGKMDGFWNMGTNAEACMDQLMTWREIGFNACVLDRRYDEYDSLPEWAQTTLAEHALDQRPWVYGLDQWDNAETHDPLWNAAQNQLRQEGRIHNYLRMLWGKKILHWSESPRDALRTMIELNNKYALDGRDPNSYSGIFWVLGRYDRAWGPERPIFGKIRYMTSDSTMNKYEVRNYIKKYTSHNA